MEREKKRVKRRVKNNEVVQIRIESEEMIRIGTLFYVRRRLSILVVWGTQLRVHKFLHRRHVLGACMTLPIYDLLCWYIPHPLPIQILYVKNTSVLNLFTFHDILIHVPLWENHVLSTLLLYCYIKSIYLRWGFN